MKKEHLCAGKDQSLWKCLHYMEKSLHVKDLREALKLFASTSKEYQIIFPRHGKYPFADAFSATTILVPCTNVEKTHWIAVFHWHNLGFLVVTQIIYEGKQTQQHSLTKTEMFQEYPSLVCSRSPDSCLCCMYVLEGALSSFWHGWMSTWKTWYLSNLMLRQGEKESCSTLSLGSVDLREDEPAASLQGRESDRAHRLEWNGTWLNFQQSTLPQPWFQNLRQYAWKSESSEHLPSFWFNSVPLYGPASNKHRASAKWSQVEDTIFFIRKQLESSRYWSKVR